MNAATIDTSLVLPDGVTQALRDFLYANRRRASAIRLMDTDWPQAALLRTLLAEYVSIALLDGRHAVVLRAIDRGALAYEKTLGQKPDWERLCGFIDSVISTLALELPGLRVVSSRGHVWTPFSGLPLQSWLAREGKCEVRREKPEAEEGERIRRAVLDHLEKQLPLKAVEHRYGPK